MRRLCSMCNRAGIDRMSMVVVCLLQTFILVTQSASYNENIFAKGKNIVTLSPRYLPLK